MNTHRLAGAAPSRPHLPAEPPGRDDHAPEQPHRWLRGHVPGEVGIWIFVMGDMVVFSVFFTIFLTARIDQPGVFAESRGELNQFFGAFNMVVLLTSSLLVAIAVRRAREGRRATAKRLFTVAAGCGVLFLAVKGLEYGQKLDHGLDPGTNDFFMYFFVFTGIHAVHVLIGIAVLLGLRYVSGREEPGRHDRRTIESGASFWHMVDLLWVVLFPLLYLAS